MTRKHSAAFVTKLVFPQGQYTLAMHLLQKLTFQGDVEVSDTDNIQFLKTNIIPIDVDIVKMDALLV